MDYSSYYRRNATYIEHDDVRLGKIADIVGSLSPGQVLDLGCGTGWLVDRLREQLSGLIVGVDVLTDVRPRGWQYVTADLTGGLPFRSDAFACVIAGEVIEHVPDPDRLLQEIHRVLAPRGNLVISTPNMVSWANRVLVPLGIQPLGTETSSAIALGRRWRALGQGNQVQGHMRVFTHRALGEILERYGFQVTERFGMPAEFPFPASLVDRLCTHVVPLASDLLYVARQRPDVMEPPSPRAYDPRRRRWARRARQGATRD